MVSPASGLPGSWVLETVFPHLRESILLYPSCSTWTSLLSSGAAPELLCAPESWVLGDPRSPMVSGALSQSLPEFSEELSIRLGSGVGRSGLVDFRRPQGRGSQPPRRRRNMAGMHNEPNSGAASWYGLGSWVGGTGFPQKPECVQAQKNRYLLGESSSELRSGSPLSRMVMQPEVWQAAACFRFSFKVKRGTFKSIHHQPRYTHTRFQKSTDLTKPETLSQCPPCFPSFFPSRQHPKFHSPRPRPKVPQKLGRRFSIQKGRKEGGLGS